MVDGELGDLCLGEPSTVLVGARKTLSELTPPGQLDDLAGVSAFESIEIGDEATLAFVSPSTATARHSSCRSTPTSTSTETPSR